DYWSIGYGSAALDPKILKQITFGEHNLCTDSGFGEMQIITCKNVLIYFNQDLKDRVLMGFYSNLAKDGFLSIGPMESLVHSSVSQNFLVIDPVNRIYRKKYHG